MSGNIRWLTRTKREERCVQEMLKKNEEHAPTNDRTKSFVACFECISYENGFLLITQIGRKIVYISIRLLLQAILGGNLSEILRGLRPRTPAALAWDGRQPLAAAMRRARFARRWPSARCATCTLLANDSLRSSVTTPQEFSAGFTPGDYR